MTEPESVLAIARDFVAEEQARLALIPALYAELLGGARPSADACIAKLTPALPLLAQLHGTAQDPEAHGEGDALAHTTLVLEALYADLDAALPGELDADACATLVLAALLHDIGKTLTTRERLWFGTQRIVASGHAREGRWYVAPLLFASGLPSRTAHAITQLVGHHELPFELPARGALAGEYARAARLADPVLLYRLARANARGRVSGQREQLCEAVEMFRMFASEYDAFDTAATAARALRDRLADTFPSERTTTLDFLAAQAARDRESGRISSPEEAIARAYGHLEHPELVIMVGPQSSGKSDYVTQRLAGHTVVRGNDLRTAREAIRVVLRAKGKVVFDAPNLTAEMRDRTCKLGFDYGALVTLVVMSTPEAERRSRIESSGTARADEPAMQWPEMDEGHRLVVVDEKAAVVFRG